MAPTAALRKRAPPPTISRPSALAGGVVKRTVVVVQEHGDGQSVTVEHNPHEHGMGTGGGDITSPVGRRGGDSLNITFVDEYDPARPNDFFAFQSAMPSKPPRSAHRPSVLIRAYPVLATGDRRRLWIAGRRRVQPSTRPGRARPALG